MVLRKVMLWVTGLLLMAISAASQAQPAVNSIARATFTPTNFPVLDWIVTFSEPVNGVSPANFSLAATGVTANLNSVTDLGGTTWRVRADNVVGDGTLGLDLTNVAGITGNSGALVNGATGEVYGVDQTSPQVTSITRLDPEVTAGGTVRYQIDFSEPVYNLSAANFVVGGNAGGTVLSIAPSGAPDVWVGTVQLDGSPGRASLDLIDTSGVTDAAGNWLASDYTLGESYAVPPQVDCIRRLGPALTGASVVEYEVTFNTGVSGFSAANVTVVGLPGVAAVTPAGPAATYTVTISGITGDGTVELVLVNPATVVESAGVAIQDFTPLTCNETIYTIDQDPPTVQCLQPLDPADASVPTSSSVVRFLVEFSEPVTSVSASNFAVTSAGLVAYSVTAPYAAPGDGSVWILEVTGVAEDTTDLVNGTLGAVFSDTTGIFDLAGNPVAAVPVCAPVVYVFDQRNPVLDCISREPGTTPELSNTTSVLFRVTFDEPVQAATVSADALLVVTNPASGFTSTSILSVTPETSGPLSAEYVVEVGPIVADPDATPPFLYNGDQSVGSGWLKLELQPDADIRDEVNLPWLTTTTLALGCTNTSYTMDLVPPRVTTATLANGDCLTSAVFTVEFSEWVTDLPTTGVEVLWAPGSCGDATTTHAVTRVDYRTFAVEVFGTSTPFHLNGPGNLTLRVLADTVQDFAGNGNPEAYESDENFVCRCFEDAVVFLPRALTTKNRTYTPLAINDLACTVTDVCTSVGLELSTGDLPTTGTALDLIRWKATEWDCATSTPFNVYVDDVLLTRTAGGADLTTLTQYHYSVQNDLCAPVGHSFETSAPETLTPGRHSVRVEIESGCAPGKTFWFNVLDAPKLTGPSGYAGCKTPRTYNFDPVEGALGYELFIRRAGDLCFTKRAEVTSGTTGFNLGTTWSLATGEYEWFVTAFNEYGHSRSDVHLFEITPDDKVAKVPFATDGTVYDILETSTTTYVAGEFSLVKHNGIMHSRSNLAAFDTVTGALLATNPNVNAAIYTLEYDAGYLYIGGRFTRIDDDPWARIARFTTAGDLVLDGGFKPGANDNVRAIAIVNDRVIYAGDFTRVGTQVYNFGTINEQIDAIRIADVSRSVSTLTTRPQALNLAPNAGVYDLLLDGDYLYIAGAFTSIGGAPVHGLARAALTSTTAVATPFNLNIHADVSHYVYTMEMVGNRLYFGGSFTSVQGEPRANAAMVEVDPATTDTAKLMPWAPEPHGGVNVVRREPGRNLIFVGGSFTLAQQSRAAYLMGVDPVMGQIMTCNFNGDRLVYALETSSVPSSSGDPRLLIGGLATTVGP